MIETHEGISSAEARRRQLAFVQRVQERRAFEATVTRIVPRAPRPKEESVTAAAARRCYLDGALPRPALGMEVQLTAREYEVVGLAMVGCRTSEIAAILTLSPDTIKSHLRHIRAKTGARSVLQLVAGFAVAPSGFTVSGDRQEATH